MENQNYFAELVADRTHPYEINLELYIRKFFEKNTDYTFEFQKNEDKYGYDLSVFKYFLNGPNYEKKLIAFIEIEISETWVNDYPEYWRDYSFLKRKIYKYCWQENEFYDELKDNADRTIYIIFNKSLTDCICNEITFIANNFKTRHRDTTGRYYNDCFMVCSKNNNNLVIRGVRNSLIKIYRFIRDKSMEESNGLQ